VEQPSAQQPSTQAHHANAAAAARLAPRRQHFKRNKHFSS
jgi:hypothetical protein